MSDCPPEDTLTAFAAGQLAAEEALPISEHLERCEQCLALVGDLARTGGEEEGRRIGPYRVVRRLGRGGMGAVYLGVHEQIRRQVAIKVLRPEHAADPLVARRFLTEAQVVNLVRHPALVEVSDHGLLDDGTPYLIMEYLEGTPLSERLARGALPEPVARALAREIALGMAAAHERGVIHRDLKPANVMLVPDPRRPGTEQVKVLDFGLAKDRLGGVSHTAVGALLGTPTYMSPEQIRAPAQADDRTDVYALGAMLYEMLAGSPPFQGAPAEVMGQHLHHEPRPLRAAAPSVSPAVAGLVAEMLAKDPRARPAMGQVAQRLAPRPPRSRRPLLLLALLLLGAGLALGATRLLGRQKACSPAGLCLQEPPTGHHLRRILCAGDGPWAVGDHGTVVRFERGRWRQVASGISHKLLGLGRTADGKVLAVGDQGTVLHLGPGPQRSASLTQSHPLTGIWPAAGETWLIGKDGALLRATAGDWEAAPAEGEGLYDIWGDGDGTLWAVGKEGTVLRRRSGGWLRLASGTREHLTAVWGSGPDDVWIAGKHGALLRFNGRGFTKVESGTTSDINGLWGAGPAELFAVGDRGTVLRFDGRRWTPLDSGTGEDLSHVCGQDRQVFIVGRGVILHFRR